MLKNSDHEFFSLTKSACLIFAYVVKKYIKVIKNLALCNLKCF